MSNGAYLIWLVVALAVVALATFRMARRRPTNSGAPGPWLSLLIWGGAIILLALLYRGYIFWTALGSLVS